MMFVYEIYWVFWDIFDGLKTWCLGKTMLEPANEHEALKKFRRVIEVFGESIPQSLLQGGLFFFILFFIFLLFFSFLTHMLLPLRNCAFFL